METHATLHAYLKESSMARHQGTEDTMGHIGLDTLPGYISFLRVSAAGIDALERAIEPYAAELARAGISWAHRSPAAVADLGALGADWQAMPAPALPDFEHALGAVYTMEGSRLGNAMMARQMQANHPELATRASAFLAYPTTPGFWRDFTGRLNEAVPDRARWPAVLAGSIAGFDLFQQSAEREIAYRNESLARAG